jgi:hypothetical protein
MALEAGLVQDGESWFSNNYDGIDVDMVDLTRFANLIAMQEREACARLCDILERYEMAIRIRARALL